ncbi:hypothetical protein [Shewanella cyperi]|uniref:hypothetical protein n=1 Tax=Shewanella cyperi TaxID=2814292 RepID=UPI001A93E1B6|nr:hypothetical protein [Shewanella cyperi]QSX42326.1 hypothetical protein JYB84_08000 [Shewanella cyperi]
MKKASLLSFASMLMLTACGGGSSDGGVSPPIQPPAPGLKACSNATTLNRVAAGGVTFVTEQNYRAQQPAMIYADLGKDSQGLNYQWRQSSGPQLELVASHSPILSFVPTSAGSYEFELSITGPGTSVTASVAINADTDNANPVKLRQDHQVTSGNAVSLRLDRVQGSTLSAIDWCASGANLNVDLSNNERPLFTAPSVSQDTLVELRASGSHNGIAGSDSAWVLITRESSITSGYFDSALARTFPYHSDSPWAADLKACTYSNQLNSSCSISRLPLLGQTANGMDKQAILDRVLVSHQWMGDNFASFLDTVDANSDFANLLQSVTAVVISYDVRPSFYWVVTGAIYLDPEDLWLTPLQRDTINEQPDYRSNFGADLKFLMPWRYVKDNEYASSIVPRTQRSHRSLDELTPDLASLLYHELAHANDFFPRSIHGSLAGPTLLDDYNKRATAKALTSDRLADLYPLGSEEMRSLANVRFRGQAASDTQKAYVPADVSSFFSNDIASDFYAYSTEREDAAMVFEELMMNYRHGVLRDVAVTDSPANPTASTVIVDWGQRGRIGDDALAQRAAFVLEGIFPEWDGTAIVASLPAPIAMQSGQSWLTNLTISPQGANTRAAVSAKPAAEIPLQFSGDRYARPRN